MSTHSLCLRVLLFVIGDEPICEIEIGSLFSYS